MLLFIQPTSRIATAAFLVMATLFGLFPFLQKLFADDGYQGPQFNALAKTLVHVNLKSSNDRIRRSASNLCPNAGLSNATLFDSIDAADLPRIGRTSIATRWRSCGLPQSASCSENFVIPPDVLGQTLKLGDPDSCCPRHH